MKVAFVSFDFGEYCVRLASGIARYAEVRLFLPENEVQPYAYLLAQSVGLQTFKKPRLRQAFRQIEMSRKLLAGIKQFKPDVIHIQQGHGWFNAALPLLRDYPLVITSHDPVKHGGEKTPQWIFDQGSFRAGEIIVHTPQMKALVLERLKVSESRVHVITHILCGDDSVHQEIQEEESLVLFFGRITEYKGLQYLIRAQPLVTARIPGARFVIAGKGESFDRYRRMMPNSDRFTICNEYISDEKRAELFRRASVVVLPYIEATQSGVIPVAYSFGKPVIATAVGGLSAQVDDGKTGYLVAPRDERALADAIVRLLADRDLRHQFGSEGKRRIAAEANPGIVASATAEVYKLCASRRRNRDGH